MSIRTKIIGAIVATTLACPPAFAVEGTDGMYYTSAAEGFYASIRARFNTGDTDGQNSSVVRDAGSRFGLQGTGEMSHGLEGFYRYELSVPDVGGAGAAGLETAISFVGLRGGFGEIRLGKWDLVEHDWVTARTDYTNNGNRPGTWNLDNDQVIQYKSPDFNGLQVGAAFRFPGGDEVSGTPANENLALPMGADSIAHPTNDLESWTLAGNYSFSGFDVGAAYSTRADGVHKLNGPGASHVDATESEPASVFANFVGFEDYNLWGVSGSYGQDNWKVGTFYKKDNMSEKGTDPFGVKHDDQTYFSVAGQVDVGKTRVIVTHDTRDNSAGQQDTATTFEVEYRLNSKAKIWVGYTGSDYDSNPATEDDVYFGLRHDF